MTWTKKIEKNCNSKLVFSFKKKKEKKLIWGSNKFMYVKRGEKKLVSHIAQSVYFSFIMEFHSIEN